jgi:hypothetical protein
MTCSSVLLLCICNICVRCIDVTSSTTFTFRHEKQQNKLTVLIQMDSNVICLFSELRWEVIFCFVNIDRIVDHHCLNFLFIIIIKYTEIKKDKTEVINFLDYVDLLFEDSNWFKLWAYEKKVKSYRGTVDIDYYICLIVIIVLECPLPCFRFYQTIHTWVFFCLKSFIWRIHRPDRHK